MNFCFESQSEFERLSDSDYLAFTTWWAKQVSEHFDLDKSDLVKIYGEDDEHHTHQRVEDLFWYGDALGFDDLPALFINGELQDSFPESTEQWIDIISSNW